MVVAALGLALLTGCGDDAEPASPAPTAAPPSLPPKPSPSKLAPGGVAACKLVGEAVQAETLMDEGVVDAIVADTKRASPFLRAAGTRLGAAYQNAVEAKGTAKADAFVLSLRQSAGQMIQTCTTANLPTG
jgi:hypothetical protein